MIEWKTVEIGNCIKTNLRSIGKQNNYSKIQYLDTGSITCNKIDEIQQFSLDNAPSRAKRIVQHEDIIYSSVRPNQLHYGFITNPPEDLIVSTGFVVITCNQDKISPKFLYYYLTQKKTTAYLHSIAEASTSTYPSLKPSDIESLEIDIPPLPEQKAIASVLSSLDDKIDLLHRQNKTLEAMAETLFRQWFIEEADESWEEKIINDLFEIRDGTHNSPKQKPFGKYLITSRHIGIHNLNFHDAYLISDEDFIDINKRSKVEQFDILFSMIGTIGLTYIEASDIVQYAIKNVGLFKTSQNHSWKYYTYLWLNSSLGKEFIHKYRSGSTQEYIALGSLRSIVFKTPPNDILKKFNNIVNPFFNKIFTNINQITLLEKKRDSLLPKLMTGEVKIEDIG